MMWVSGPSSSGKTTTTVKLTERLQKQGLRFLMLNLDDYFWSLVEHPTDWINDRNYETPEAMDIQLLNSHLVGLLAGETIEKPIYSFKEGRRVATKPIKLEPGQILLLDCLHGLYPPITEGIPAAAQFRLYIETQNVLYEGDGSSQSAHAVHRRAPVAAHAARRPAPQSRPLLTILHWHYVRSGELFSIIPLSGLADHVVNGGFPFDLPALKPFFCGPDGYLPRPEDFAILHRLPGCAHPLRAGGSAAGVGRGPEQGTGQELRHHPRRRGHPRVRRRQHDQNPAQRIGDLEI